MMAFKRILRSGRLARYRLVALLVSVVVVTQIGFVSLPDWQNVKGWEAYDIAKALVVGKGFSLPFSSTMGFDAVNNGAFHPTAWADPLYTFCLAGLIWIFAGYHQLAALVFNLVLLLAVFGLTYLLGERLISASAGVMAVLALALIRGFSYSTFYMNNTMLAATLIVLSALMFVKFLERPDYLRAGSLGLVLGLAALGCPSAQFFILVAATGIVVTGWRDPKPAISQTILVLFVAGLTILPWTTRNYLVFGEFVPVRSGAGWNIFAGSVATAGTVAPDSLRSHIKPPWRAETLGSAVKQATQRDMREALDRFQVDYVKEVGPAEFDTMNEVQRDTWFFQESKAFLLTNPVLSAKLAITKIKVFIRIMGPFGVLVCLLAALGGLLAIRTPAALTLALWVGTYVGPFFLIICYYDRYRAPIEPLLVVLAAFAICRGFNIVSPNRRMG